MIYNRTVVQIIECRKSVKCRLEMNYTENLWSKRGCVRGDGCVRGGGGGGGHH